MYLQGIIKGSFNLKMDKIMSSAFDLAKYLKFTIGLSLLLLAVAVNADSEQENLLQAERYRQAGHPATTAAIFSDLSSDKYAAIRKRVASNRKTPKNILLRLASDLDQSVKISVATNLSAGEDVYLILARDSMTAVRSVVARFEYVPVLALKILAKDKDVDIRMEVARNLNANEEVLLQLTHDSDSTVSAVAELALQRLYKGK